MSLCSVVKLESEYLTVRHRILIPYLCTHEVAQYMQFSKLFTSEWVSIGSQKEL
jgi:hypothetical protein